MPCCSSGKPATTAVTPPSTFPTAPIANPWHRRIATFTQWAIPLTTLAFVPKCPGCVAGYVLLLTGIGVSFNTAAAMRWCLIAISVAALAYLAFRAARRANLFIAQCA
jgi:hypothetical protein